MGRLLMKDNENNFMEFMFRGPPGDWAPVDGICPVFRGQVYSAGVTVSPARCRFQHSNIKAPINLSTTQDNIEKDSTSESYQVAVKGCNSLFVTIT